MRILGACFFVIVGVWLPSAEATAEARSFVEKGRAVAIREVGRKWTAKQGYLECFGLHNFLVADRTLGAGDFCIHARLSLEKLDDTAASLVINGNHFGFDAREHGKPKYHVEGPQIGGLRFLDSSLASGTPFEVEAVRTGPVLTFRVDGRDVCRVPFTQNEVVQFGLRPWRATMRVHEFSAEGNLAGPPQLPTGGDAFDLAPENAVPVRPPNASRPFTSGTEGYHTFRIPAVVVTGKGTVLALCEGRKTSASDTGDIDMVAKRSFDGGRTWQPLQRIWDDGPNTCGNPCPVVDRATGVVWLLITHNLGEDGETALGQRKSKGTRTVWVTKSSDDGATWTNAVEITSTTKRPEWGWYATGPGVGIQLHSPPHAGRLLIPCNHSVQPDPAHPERFEYGDHAIYSDDHGATWRLGGAVPSLKIDEAQVVELSDGSILMNSRSHFGLGCRTACLSRDGGQTWGAVRHERALIEPNCQASFLRYDDATGGRPRLLFSNPASTTLRRRLTVRVSDDGGATWPVARLIDSGPCAYSCLTVLPDGTIGCLYECGRKHAYEGITFAWFGMDWLRGDATRPSP